MDIPVFEYENSGNIWFDIAKVDPDWFNMTHIGVKIPGCYWSVNGISSSKKLYEFISGTIQNIIPDVSKIQLRDNFIEVLEDTPSKTHLTLYFNNSKLAIYSWSFDDRDTTYLAKKIKNWQIEPIEISYNDIHTIERSFEKVRYVEGNFVQAIWNFNRAIELKKDDAAAYNNLAWIYATCNSKTWKDGTKAIQLALKSIAIKECDDNLDTLAAACVGDKQYARAFRIYKEALHKYNNLIKYYQKRLYMKGYYSGNTDGVFSLRMEEAMRKCIYEGHYL